MSEWINACLVSHKIAGQQNVYHYGQNIVIWTHSLKQKHKNMSAKYSYVRINISSYSFDKSYKLGK